MDASSVRSLNCMLIAMYDSMLITAAGLISEINNIQLESNSLPGKQLFLFSRH